MARNKYPEETVNRILAAALRLFLERGYERTSIQDILDELGGLTKGAIYHHFGSKEEIMLAVADRLYADVDAHMVKIRDDPRLSGRQKLEAMFSASLHNPKQNEMFAAAPNLLNNPTFLTILMRNMIEDVVPHYVLPVLEQGNADGSLQVEHPRETAELLMLLFNVWANPMLYPATGEGFRRKAELLLSLTRHLGVDVVDETMLNSLDGYRQLYEERSQ